ncbi:hypothetical protein TWF481_011866 [Arthrobotrys musiformis]|uniref:Uncharacterized protein n=1 Tax=Arthrobotrys musiformis TaxID=47236 RepID=A0AAV9VVD0_9PEZI
MGKIKRWKEAAGWRAEAGIHGSTRTTKNQTSQAGRCEANGPYSLGVLQHSEEKSRDNGPTCQNQQRQTDGQETRICKTPCIYVQLTYGCDGDDGTDDDDGRESGDDGDYSNGLDKDEDGDGDGEKND